MKVTGWVCGPRVYEFDGWLFEVPAYTCPWPLKKDGEPRARAGRKFWDVVARFDKLSDKEKKAHRVGGGCIPIGE